MKTTYEEIVNVKKIGQKGVADMTGILSLAKRERIRIASQDKIKRLLLCKNIQKDYMEGGILPVPNSVKDVENITRFIYNNMENITKIVCSMNTHTREQIFHPCWWINSAGNHPEAYTIITYKDVANGKWKVLNKNNQKKSKQYLKQLEKSSKKKLCIWPYNCLRGSDGYALENEFAKIIRFHSAVRITKSEIIRRGDNKFLEMYGIIKSEVGDEDCINRPILKMIEEYDEIYVVGEAASHFVVESLKQIAEHFAEQPEIIQKITVLTDCTSPIEGFEEETAKIFNMLNKTYGMKFEKSTDIKME